MKDSRGNHSKTLPLVYIAFAVGTFAFIYSTINGNSDLSAYGLFVSTSLLPWVGREAIEKIGKKNDST